MLQQSELNVERDAVTSERYIKELSKVCWDMFRATGAMFEQEHVRFISMFIAAGSGGNGGGHRFNKGIMEQGHQQLAVCRRRQVDVQTMAPKVC